MKLEFRDYSAKEELMATFDTSDHPIPRAGEDIEIYNEDTIRGRVLKVEYRYAEYEGSREKRVIVYFIENN